MGVNPTLSRTLGTQAWELHAPNGQKFIRLADGHEVAIKFSNCVGENNLLVWRVACAHVGKTREREECGWHLQSHPSIIFSPAARITLSRVSELSPFGSLFCCADANLRKKSPKSLIYAAVACLYFVIALSAPRVCRRRREQ